MPTDNQLNSTRSDVTELQVIQVTVDEIEHLKQGISIVCRKFDNENLFESDLRGKTLSKCNFAHAQFAIGQDLTDAKLQYCSFGLRSIPERDRAITSYDSLNFTRANLEGALFQYSTLLDCNFAQVNLTDSDFTNSNCEGCNFASADLTGANLTDSNLFRSRFNKTRISLRRQPILQDRKDSWHTWCQDHRYQNCSESERLEQGVAIYLELKENYRSIGAYSEASWAYVQERRLRRAQHGPLVAQYCYGLDYPTNPLGKSRFYIKHTVLWLADSLLDLSTGYGESLLRTFLSLLIPVVLIFPFMYAILGGVLIRDPSSSNFIASVRYPDLLLFSIGNLTQGYPDVEAATSGGHIVQVFQQFYGILLVGLLGFVLGNKIRQT